MAGGGWGRVHVCVKGGGRARGGSVCRMGEQAWAMHACVGERASGHTRVGVCGGCGAAGELVPPCARVMLVV